jgi:hypothetical protein
MATTKHFIQLKQVLNTSLNGIVSDEHSDYVQNYVAVCNYVKAADSSLLPTLSKSLPQVEWDKYTRNFIAAKKAAEAWTDEVVSRLERVPASIVSDNSMVLELFKSVINLCDELISDPSDVFLKQKLKNKIEIDAIPELNDLTGELDGVIHKLEVFNSTLPTQVEELKKIVDLAKNDEDVDTKKINELQSSIDEMKNEIKSLTAAIVGLAIADAVAIILSVVAIAAAGPFGAVTWIFTGAAIAAATTFIVIDGMKIKSLKAKIEQTQKDMNDYTADVSALQLASQNFADLANQAALIEANLRYILTAWQSLKEDLEKVASEMTAADVDYSSEDWEAIKQDFQEAATLWDAFIKHVKVYEIPISGNTCQLESGMSSQEVSAAVKAGTNLNLMDYLHGKMAS